MKEGILKTPYQLECEARDEAVAKRYYELVGNPKNSKMAVLHKVMEEFNIHAESTVYAACTRYMSRKEAEDGR